MREGKAQEDKREEKRGEPREDCRMLLRQWKARKVQALFSSDEGERGKEGASRSS